VTRHDDMATSIEGEAVTGREKNETTSVGPMQILLDQKIKKIRTVDSTAINRR
jgi:hypothetical protein